jgi:uncharacterized membrane protein
MNTPTENFAAKVIVKGVGIIVLVILGFMFLIWLFGEVAGFVDAFIPKFGKIAQKIKNAFKPITRPFKAKNINNTFKPITRPFKKPGKWFK